MSALRLTGLAGRKSSNGNETHVSTQTECYTCSSQLGIPIFHSTTCVNDRQPQWQAYAGSSFIPIQTADPNNNYSPNRVESPCPGCFGPVLDPRSPLVKKWNRALVLARGIALAVDPLFFYVFALYVGEGGAPCVHVDNELAVIVTILRTCLDAVHLCHVWLQFRMAYVSRESLVIGCGKLVWDARAIASHYLRSLKRFWFDVFVVLPIPQFAGGCFYALATQRIVSCLEQQCERNKHCNVSFSCSKIHTSPLPLTTRNSLCMDDKGPFNYGIYAMAIPVVSSHSRADTILYPIFWGLLNLSSFGNELQPTSNLIEVIFSICIVLGGLTLFTLLVGNIQVSLSVVTARRKKLQLRGRDIEWWMSRRQLPTKLRKRVRRFERRSWSTMGEDELQWIDELPEGLRRDIKRYLCLDLIKKVPLFHNLDDLILDDICDRAKPLVYSKDEKIIKEGEPVQRMIFVVCGHIKSSQSLSKGKAATSVIEPGGFLGDELLSWCLRRPFINRLPTSSATFTCGESVEAFGLDANDIRYITDHFRYKFSDEKLKRRTRYYSSNWRTWAAVKIQFAWRKYKIRARGPEVNHVMRTPSFEDRLRQYAAVFMSIRPHDHLQ